MKVRCIKSFNDLQQGKYIEKGTEFDVTVERAKELSSTDNIVKMALVELLEEVPESIPEEVTKSTQEEEPKKKARGKKNV